VFGADGGGECAAVRAAAIVYMYVEPAYRGRFVGRLALEATAFLHATRGCDYTLLVANDKSDDQQLVEWYERAGFSRAPALQEVLGSPDGMYGITMIAATRQSMPDDCVIQWW
jgi:GNAT superfamily N-acetyltransferase